MEMWSRRKFFLTSLAGSAIASANKLFGRAMDPLNVANPLPTAAETAAQGKRPLIISSANGLHALDRGMDILKKGGDTLDAVVAAVTVVEDDPNDDSVGFGGLPNEEGEVELDASCMHGPTGRAGSVASVRRIKNVSRLAKTVMERTNHVMIVGEGAHRFAIDEGFEDLNLLTERSRLAWLAWKASTSFNWRPGIDSPKYVQKSSIDGYNQQIAAIFDTPEKRAWLPHIQNVIAHPPTGTIPCMAVDAKGDISATTTTSGLAWKIPGRVGDSPIIGAGCFVDNEVGAAGSTGKGEENIKIAGGHTIVEMMRRGKSPSDACLEAMSRVAHNYKNDKKKLATFHIFFYAINKNGQHGAASLWRSTYDKNKHASYAVHDGTQARLVETIPFLDEVPPGEPS
ncbi:MAG: N4-(beta-N-acetylglucosaminyl)-L-asparaginase [Acidobacteriaceae bacterium]|jgi:N4-(beta-N-acetylglucosaminyl)-L-asparaginase|nr:N4-(beta-N-acetylglucosaminyl)-L-asparaginase [Acidobacteriaceae bacterium]